jgi:hypothetical protein
MSLNAQQNDALKFQLAQLLDYDEPAAFIATLQRIAERKAYAASRASNYDAAIEWQRLAKAVKRVAEALELEARHITDTQQPAI